MVNCYRTSRSKCIQCAFSRSLEEKRRKGDARNGKCAIIIWKRNRFQWRFSHPVVVGRLFWNAIWELPLMAGRFSVLFSVSCGRSWVNRSVESVGASCVNFVLKNCDIQKQKPATKKILRAANKCSSNQVASHYVLFRASLWTIIYITYNITWRKRLSNEFRTNFETLPFTSTMKAASKSSSNQG